MAEDQDHINNQIRGYKSYVSTTVDAQSLTRYLP